MKVVCITGASSGLGAKLAKVYAAAGFQVIAVARRLDLLEDVGRGLDQVHAIVGDVTDLASMQSVFQFVREKFGRLDILIANAGYAVYGEFRELTPADFNRQLQTNVMGVINTVHAGLPLLIANQGRIAVTGSASGYIGLPRRSAYATSKFALRGLCESLGIELASAGVSVTLVTAGYLDTPTREVDNMGKHSPGLKNPAPEWLLYDPSKAARQIFRAIRRRRREVYIAHHARMIVYIQRLLPGLVPAIIAMRRKAQPA
jgi:NAD(P)-dependent dehydrogenase (short-subunit alcohol dehydrogenase family)